MNHCVVLVSVSLFPTWGHPSWITMTPYLLHFIGCSKQKGLRSCFPQWQVCVCVCVWLHRSGKRLGDSRSCKQLFAGVIVPDAMAIIYVYTILMQTYRWWSSSSSSSSSVISQAHLSPTPTCATPGATLLLRGALSSTASRLPGFCCTSGEEGSIPVGPAREGGLIFTFRFLPRTTYGKTTN